MRFKEGSIHKKNEDKINLIGLKSGRISRRAVEQLAQDPAGFEQKIKDLLAQPQPDTNKDE